jgi:hypothetical protein
MAAGLPGGVWRCIGARQGSIGLRPAGEGSPLFMPSCVLCANEIRNSSNDAITSPCRDLFLLSKS